MIFLFCLLALASNSFTKALANKSTKLQRTNKGLPPLSTLIQRCKNLDHQAALKNIKSLISQEAFEEIMDRYVVERNAWLSKQPWVQQSQEFTPGTVYDRKHVLPAGSEVFFFMDLHGDIRSLVTLLSYFADRKMLNEDFTLTRNPGEPLRYLIFAGDYVDRGIYSIEVLWTLARLQLANPDQVILLQGNHDTRAWHTQNWTDFHRELYYKFRLPFSDLFKSTILAKTLAFFDLLPIRTYIGTKTATGSTSFITVCHGATELGANPQLLLTHDSNDSFSCLQRDSAAFWASLQKNCNDLKNELKLQNHEIPQVDNIWWLANWGDYNAHGDQKTTIFNGRFGSSDLSANLCYGSTLHERVLDRHSSDQAQVQAVFRGHQHNASMPQLFDPKNHGCWVLNKTGGWVRPVITCCTSGSCIEQPHITAFTKLTVKQGPVTTWAMEQIWYDRNKLRIFQSQKVFWAPENPSEL